MRIAIIINTSWNIYNFRAGLVRYFLSRGDQVIAIAPVDGYSEKLVEWGCEFHAVEMSGTGMNPFKDLQLCGQLKRVLERTKPDVLLTYTIKPNIYGALISRVLRIPCICNVSGLGTVFLWTGILEKIARALYTFSFRFSSWVFFQNQDDRSLFLSKVGLSHAKTSVLPGSGVDVTRFSPRPLVTKDKVVFLMISRLIVEKGVRDYVAAIRILKEQEITCEFHLIGRLDEHHARSVKKEELEAWVDEGLVIYKPSVEDVRADIERADAIVLASYREGLSRTLLEGGAIGRALIATDVPGCREVVEDGVNGFLVELKNPSHLADKMRLFASLSFSERAEMGAESCRIITAGFSEQVVVSMYQNKIDQLLLRN